MVKIAIPINENMLSKKFSSCSHFEIIEIEKNKITKRSQENPEQQSWDKLCHWIENIGITDLIVHEIDKKIMDYFADTKINLFVGIIINSPEAIITEYINGTLKSNSKKMAGQEKSNNVKHFKIN